MLSWYMRKDDKVGHCHMFVTGSIFVVSTFTSEASYKTFDFSVLQAYNQLLHSKNET